jgi:glutamine amidotransferase
MCRLLAASNLSHQDFLLVLTAFQSQAETGAVPFGVCPGHRDGWGIVGGNETGLTFIRKEPTDFTQFNEMAGLVEEMKRNEVKTFIAHIRKKSIGDATRENTHPFVMDGWVFAHNGTILDAERIPLTPEQEKRIQGETDSERLFAALRPCFDEPDPTTIQQALRHELTQTLEGRNWTPGTFVATNGRILVACRWMNTQHPAFLPYRLHEYYTIFFQKHGQGWIVASEPANSHGNWDPLPDRSVLITTQGQQQLFPIDLSA